LDPTQTRQGSAQPRAWAEGTFSCLDVKINVTMSSLTMRNSHSKSMGKCCGYSWMGMFTNLLMRILVIQYAGRFDAICCWTNLVSPIAEARAVVLCPGHRVHEDGHVIFLLTTCSFAGVSWWHVLTYFCFYHSSSGKELSRQP
jgi:hypothetical protein